MAGILRAVTNCDSCIPLAVREGLCEGKESAV